ncbi:FkbM family methyltransferase [Flavihumibacter sp. R14]|nr:FkbM family methyltransferase [Flavihumibacter soli]
MHLLKFLRNFRRQRQMINFYKAFIKEGDLCFDIGANIGERTNCFLKLGAKVITLEPQSSCFAVLQSKYRNNKQVKLIRSAAGSEEKEDQLMICDETDECSTLSKEFINSYSAISGLNWNKTEKVKVITLESLCRSYGVPKLCKIDVEGYESEVMRGLQSPIKYICFEFNRALLSDTSKSLEILGTLGNYRCNFIKYEIMSLVSEEWLPLEEFRSKLDQIITPDILTGEIVAEHLDY